MGALGFYPRLMKLQEGLMTRVGEV